MPSDFETQPPLGSVTPDPGSDGVPARNLGGGTVGSGNQGKFSAVCFYSHSLPDDPIVYPGQPGLSHMHDFVGNAGTNAYSTLDSLLAGQTNCDNVGDTASYWEPTVSENGVEIHAIAVTVYYLSNGKSNDIVPPQGLKMIAGNAHATGPSGYNHEQWGCGNVFPTSLVAINCPAGTEVHTRMWFPDCWDGKHLDSWDHHSHMSYQENGVCPAGWPVPIAQLSPLFRYKQSDGANFTLSSGPTYTQHVDFFNGWQIPALQLLVNQCDHPGINCPTNNSATPSPVTQTPPPPGS